MIPARTDRPVTATRYAVAVHAIASAIAAELDAAALQGDAAWERAEAALLRQRTGPHRWVFEGTETLVASTNVLEALDVGPSGERDFLQGDLGFAATAVARFDVFQKLLELREMDVAGEEAEADGDGDENG